MERLTATIDEATASESTITAKVRRASPEAQEDAYVPRAVKDIIHLSGQDEPTAEEAQRVAWLRANRGRAQMAPMGASSTLSSLSSVKVGGSSTTPLLMQALSAAAGRCW